MSDETYTLSPDFFLRCFVNGWIVDARDGGLILGRSHDDGHILMFQPTSSLLGEYEFRGYVEGGEFIMSPGATEEHMERLQEINSDLSPCDAPFRLSEESRIIKTHAEPHDKYLVIGRQFIINRNATRRHFQELQELNSGHSYHNGRILTDDDIKTLRSIKF